MACQLLATALQAKTGQHLVRLRRIRGKAAQSGCKSQVFIHRHGFLERIEVAQVAQVLAINVTLGLDGGAVPADLTGFDRGQAAHHAQQTGLAHAIGPRHIQPASGVQHAVNIVKQLAPTATAAKLGKRQLGRSFQAADFTCQNPPAGHPQGDC